LPIVNRSPEQLRKDALAIWQAGVEAVRSDRLVRENVRVRDHLLEIAGETCDLRAVRRIAVVGAGKAGAGMAAGLEEALGQRIASEKHLTGWINVPADCVRKLQTIHLHAARPAGVNEPTPEGVAGSREIMNLVASLGREDLCIALISGGGSALLPLPIEGITLDDKLAVTRFLSAAGAPIDELNTVRKQLSQVKGGGLARACKAGRLVTLVISDVLGDPLDLIASGPTVADRSSPADALAILERYGAKAAGIDRRVFDALARKHAHASVSMAPLPAPSRTITHVIGNNAAAVAAAAEEAQRRGYAPTSVSAAKSEGSAEEIGRHLAGAALVMRAGPGSDCLVSGGEPTVKLVEAARRGLGGRNQQLVLAAAKLLETESASGILILSGGTDGEDGPTDAAGAFADAQMIEAARRLGLEPGDYLARNDAYHWFEPLGGLVKTGPTHTNVCDVRVVLVDRLQESP
jgi:hydroxypyruvate reductase